LGLIAASLVLPHYGAIPRKYSRLILRRGFPKARHFLMDVKDPLKKEGLNSFLNTISKKAKLNNGFSVHSLRHSIAVHILDAGQSIEYVQDHLGHKNIQNTQSMPEFPTQEGRKSLTT
jgi:site-specific recombinase XerD